MTTDPKPHVYLRSELRMLMGAIALAAQTINVPAQRERVFKVVGEREEW